MFKYGKKDAEGHTCGEYYCRSCERTFTQRHECYMRSQEGVKLGKNEKDQLTIFFDIESRQTTVFQCKKGHNPGSGRCQSCSQSTIPCTECSRCQNCKEANCGSLLHEANLVVAQKVCNMCSGRPFLQDEVCQRCGDRCFACSIRSKKAGPRVYNVKPCENREQCGLRHRVFYGEKCLESFFNWLITDMHNGATVICHNGSGYDHVLLLNELMKNRKLVPADVIFSGTRLLFMELKNPVHIRFIDSYKFLSFPLATLPAAF